MKERDEDRRFLRDVAVDRQVARRWEVLGHRTPEQIWYFPHLSHRTRFMWFQTSVYNRESADHVRELVRNFRECFADAPSCPLPGGSAVAQHDRDLGRAPGQSECGQLLLPVDRVQQ